MPCLCSSLLRRRGKVSLAVSSPPCYSASWWDTCSCLLPHPDVNYRPDHYLWPFAAGVPALSVPVLCLSCRLQQWNKWLYDRVCAHRNFHSTDVHTPCCHPEHTWMGKITCYCSNVHFLSFTGISEYCTDRWGLHTSSSHFLWRVI